MQEVKPSSRDAAGLAEQPRCSRKVQPSSRDAAEMRPRGRDAHTLSKCRSTLPVPRCVCPIPSRATHRRRPPVVEGREKVMRLAVGETRAPPTSKVRVARAAAVWFPTSSRSPNLGGWPCLARLDNDALVSWVRAVSIGLRCNLARPCRSAANRTSARSPHSKTRISVTLSGEPTGVGPQPATSLIRSALFVPSAVSASRIDIYPRREA